MNPQRMKRSQRLAALAVLGLAVAALSALAVAVLGDNAVGALLGVLVLLGALGLQQQVRNGRRFAAVSRTLDATDRRLAAMEKKVAAQSESNKQITDLSKTVAQWSTDLREAEMETGIAALNRYVALGSDDATRQA